MSPCYRACAWAMTAYALWHAWRHARDMRLFRDLRDLQSLLDEIRSSDHVRWEWVPADAAAV